MMKKFFVVPLVAVMMLMVGSVYAISPEQEAINQRADAVAKFIQASAAKTAMTSQKQAQATQLAIELALKAGCTDMSYLNLGNAADADGDSDADDAGDEEDWGLYWMYAGDGYLAAGDLLAVTASSDEEWAAVELQYLYASQSYGPLEALGYFEDADELYENAEAYYSWAEYYYVEGTPND